MSAKLLACVIFATVYGNAVAEQVGEERALGTGPLQQGNIGNVGNQNGFFDFETLTVRPNSVIVNLFNGNPATAVGITLESLDSFLNTLVTQTINNLFYNIRGYVLFFRTLRAPSNSLSDTASSVFNLFVTQMRQDAVAYLNLIGSVVSLIFNTFNAVLQQLISVPLIG